MNDIFSIFNPDWWMDENNNALQMTDAVLFLLLAIPVAYLFIYALASLRKYKNPYPPSPKRHRFLVLFVVLKNGKEVIESINHFLDTQTYPREIRHRSGCHTTVRRRLGYAAPDAGQHCRAR